MILISVLAGVFVYQPLWQNYSDFRPWHLGLDLDGGSFLVYEIDLSGVNGDERDSVVQGLRDVIERRVNFFGVSEPRVYTQDAGDSRRLVVELAGIKDVNEAILLIGETPVLDFREVEETEEGFNYIQTELTGRYIKKAQLIFDQIVGQPSVSLEFTGEGARIFEELTARNVGKPIAIFLDGALIEQPIVREKISGGKAQITGRFTLDEARAMVQRFNAGALSAPIKLISQETVSAELGKDSLQKILAAGIFGLIAVVAYMIIYYRRLGIFAAAALLMYVALTLAIFKIIPITLTLSGIAGFILSIGMAVDANILVFERTKEELKKGVAWDVAIEAGFKRAWSSIRDSNITTVLSAVILYYITTSFVRGFALALIVGVLLSMFSALVITRIILRVFSK